MYIELILSSFIMKKLMRKKFQGNCMSSLNYKKWTSRMKKTRTKNYTVTLKLSFLQKLKGTDV